MVEKKQMKILITGLPRSGTTILTNYINSMENSFCFIEPYWEYERTGKSKFFKDEKLKNCYYLKYKKNETLPLDKAVDKILKKYDFVGLKETFRSNAYKNIAPEIINENLLRKHKGKYKIIGIVRNPLNVWNSLKSFEKNKSSWAGNIDLFIQNYCNFFKFIEPNKPIVYENFVLSPKETLKKININTKDITNILHRNSGMGDKTANLSSVLRFQKKEKFFTRKEGEIINNSKAMQKYLELL